jgi:hypothetical protein
MDPNANLEELRRKLNVLRGPLSTKDRNRLLEAFTEEFEALDEWITKGGFLPEAWRHLR